MDNKDQVGPIIHSKKRFKDSIDKKWIIIAVISVLVLLGGYWIISTIISQIPSKQEVNYQLINDANELANKGDINGAKAAYDTAINKTSDNVLKASLLTSKAALFYNEKNYDQALAIALEAEALNPSESTAQFIASVYLLKADKVNAVVYYKKSIELIDKTKYTDGGKEMYYQGIIDSLTGSN